MKGRTAITGMRSGNHLLMRGRSSMELLAEVAALALKMQVSKRAILTVCSLHLQLKAAPLCGRPRWRNT